MTNKSGLTYGVLLGASIVLGVVIGSATGQLAIWLPIGLIVGMAAGRVMTEKKQLTKNAGMVIGLGVAALGAAGLLAGYLPRMLSGLIAIVAIGIIVGTRRAALRNAER